MTERPDPELIDELASRLLDDDISLTEIDSALHAPVLARRAVFAAQRDRLRRETPVSTSHSHSRSVRFTVLGLAAAAVVGLVGIAVSSRRDSADTTNMATSFSVATEAPAAASMAPAAASMAPAVAPEAADASGMASRALATCVDPLGRPSIFVGYYNSEQVDVHFSPADGVAVYRTSDCAPVLDIVP